MPNQQSNRPRIRYIYDIGNLVPEGLPTKEIMIAQLQELFGPKVVPINPIFAHVAKGEQEEAEAILKSPGDIQALLKKIQKFTDYSGRTFECTAYEYAYWAKDTHMCRMLEKYMDDTTKHDLLQRVRSSEELVGEGLFKHSRGLAYTQNGEKQRSAHFDLTPLKQALKTYIDAYNQSPKQTDADWEALDTLWLKVGFLQRDVPAHIAQEYCHPNRSFEGVSQNPSLLDAANPNNLVRQLKFYNGSTSGYDSWFTHDSSNSGLGSLFAILRGAREGGMTLRTSLADHAGGALIIDLAAIEAVDKARTDDLEQSRANLLGAPSSNLSDSVSLNSPYPR